MMSLLALLWLCSLVAGASLPDLECPEECDCHYFRINWVTDCSDSNLTAVPTPAEGLSLEVYVLNMNGNNLTELVPFPQDIQLKKLLLADNHITNITYDVMSTLAFLIEVDLSDNNIVTIEPHAFRDNPGLLSVNLRNNALNEIEGPFLSSQSLTYLDLSDCSIAHLNQQFFTNVTALNTLDLSGNPLGTVNPGVLGALGNLEELKLNRCNLSHLPDAIFSNLTHLKSLELTENKLTNVDWTLVLSPLGLLETLNIRKSAITNLPEDAFKNNPWLRNLVLAENQLRDLDIATTLGQNVLQLESLDLTNCNLRGPLSEYAFANATKLKTLILTGNLLSASDLMVALAPLNRLHKLSLTNCGLNRLPENTFDRLSVLEELDISRNPLNDVFTSILSPLESLRYLNMGYSNLSYISKSTFSKMNQLECLVLSGNPLINLEYGLFHNLTKLKTLELNNCGLRNAPDAQVFTNDEPYMNLENLKLAGNPLRFAEKEPLLPMQLGGVLELDISNCNLVKIPADAFVTTPNITTLKLSGNPIGTQSATLPANLDFLNALHDLTTLDLSHCNLTRISPKYFQSRRSMKSLRLVGNPWVCECGLAELWSWASESKCVLEGEEPAPRRSQGLVCRHEGAVRRRRLVAERTWASYAKDSGCTASRVRRDATWQSHLLDSPATASWPVAVVATVVCSVVLAVAASIVRRGTRVPTPLAGALGKEL